MTEIPHIRIGTPGKPLVVMAHGWDRTHRDFIPVAEALAPSADCVLVDLPGFGESAKPAETWSTLDYAARITGFIREEIGAENCIWVGHSFGGRVGMRLAVADPDLLNGLVLVASAGIPRERSGWELWRGRHRQAAFKRRKARASGDKEIAALEREYGSADYVRSRETGMREIFLKTIAEDQSADLPRIACPTRVLTGAEDTETPPETGRRIVSLIPQAEFTELPEFDHISILDRGRHQIALMVKELIAGAGDG